MSDGTEVDAKFKGKRICAFKNYMRNLVNVHRLKQMNSKCNETFYTCLTELPLFLDLRYK